MKAMQKALVAVGLMLVAVAVGIGVLRQGGGPNPVTDADAWVSWATRDPIMAFIGLFGALMAGVGAVAGLMQILGPKPQSRDEAARAQDRIRATVEDGDAETQRLVKEVLAQLVAGRDGGAADDAATADARVDAVQQIVESGDAAEQEAARLIADGRVDEGFARLREDARAGDQDAAEKWRRLGALAFAVNVTEARAAYQKAAERDPADVWTHIYLSRLDRTTGDLGAARRSAEAALAAATIEKDRGAALSVLGDVARAEGDLPGARKAYEDGLVIRRDLSARDPKNASWRRDLWTSLWHLADLPDGGVTWVEVREALAAEQARGTLFKDDEPFLDEATRRAAD
ncbi:MAG: hypothetical protein O9257_05740 [Brevundimonas sp.]|nr:hypothetical protein [Brevundimonas sp.]